MSLRDAYLRGSDVLNGARSAVAVELDMPGATTGDFLLKETERAAAALEADECRRRAAFESGPKLVLVDATARPSTRLLPSEIPNVSDEAWTCFVFAMKTAQPGAISASNALGMFELKARRLADLGLVKDIKRARSPLGRLMWVGEFVPPLTQRDFLSKSAVQYRTFVDSMRLYIDGLCNGTIVKPEGGFPAGMTLSGALAVLHRGGPNGLKGWNDEDDRFEDTVALFERANGIF